MNIRTIIIIFLITQGCGTKLTSNLKSEITKIDEYVEKIKTTENLTESITEGTVEYGENFKEIGGFEYYEYYSPENGKLHRVEYFMNTDENLIENFYYKNDELIFAESVVNFTNGESKKTKIYLKNEKLIYELNSDYVNSKDLIKSGTKYLTEFKTEKIKASL